MTISRKSAVALAACSCLLLPIFAQAQTQPAGRITGTVRDPQGAYVQQASVEALNLGTGERSAVATDEVGNFSFASLQPGTYRVSIDALGFATAVAEGVYVDGKRTATLKVTLSVSPSTYVVTVQGTPPLIQTDGPQIQTNLDMRAVTELPLPTRNFLQLVTLAPGVSVDLTNNNAIGRNSPNFSVNGARTEQNNLQINGVYANDVYGHDLGAVGVPAPESIQEAIVQTSMYDASLGNAGGANIQVNTKSGTNVVHGSVYEYFRNDALNANDANLKHVGVPRPVLRRNVYGAAVGGPVRKDRVFYFFSYQGTREANGATDQSIYKGVLIAPGLTNDRSETTLLKTFHPVLPDGSAATSINPIALKLLNTKLPNRQFLIPTPQQADGRVSGTATSRYHEEQFNTNFDFHLSARDSVSAKLFFSDAPWFNALAGASLAGAAFGGRNLPGFGLAIENDNRLVSIILVHTFSPSTVNEVRFGYNFLRNSTMPQEALRDSSLGIERPTAEQFPGMSTILLARDAGGGSVGSTWVTLNGASEPTWSISELISLRRGHHTLRVGGEFLTHAFNVHANVNTYGEIDFATFNDFLTGNSDFSSIGVGISHRKFRSTDYDVFVQDDWKVAHNLTLNAGLRYELNLPPYERHGLIGGFDPALYHARMQVGPDGMPVGPPAGGIVMAGNSSYSLAGIPKVGARVLNSVSPKNFGPRLGFSWSPLNSSRLVFRGGYGIFYSEPSFFYLAWDWFSPPFYQNFVSSAHMFARPFPDVPPESSFPLIQPGYTLATNPFDRNLRTPYFQHFNASVQYEFLRSTVLQVAYVGTRGLRLFRQVNINQARIASVNHPVINEVTGEMITVNTNANAPLRAPMQGVDTAFFNLNQSNGQSTYHSLQAIIKRPLSRGIEVQASYTFSKSIDNASFPGLDTATIVGSQFVPQSNRGLSDFDRTHRFVGYFLWDLPRFRLSQSSGISRAALSGWQVSGIVTVMSGAPVDLFDPSGGSLYGLAGGRPNWAPGANYRTATTNVPAGYFFNPFAFSMAVVQPGQAIASVADPTALAGDIGTDLGNVGRNLLRGPGQSNVDFSVMKRLLARESRTLELRVDLFNVFNHANKSNPIADISTVLGSGGSIDPNTGRILTPGDFGRIVNFTGSPRIIQFAVKCSF